MTATSGATAVERNSVLQNTVPFTQECVTKTPAVGLETSDREEGRPGCRCYGVRVVMDLQGNSEKKKGGV